MFAGVLVGATLGAGTTALAQSAKDLTCNSGVQDFLQTCQKRITPAVRPVDPNNPTAAEQKSLDKHAKAWQACKEKAATRSTACRR